MICQYCGGVIAHYYGCRMLTIVTPGFVQATPLLSYVNWKLQ